MWCNRLSHFPNDNRPCNNGCQAFPHVFNLVTKYNKGKDGKINVNDLNYGLRGLTRNTLTEEEKQLGDVNGDNKFNVNDLNKMLRYLVGKIKTLD